MIRDLNDILYKKGITTRLSNHPEEMPRWMTREEAVTLLFAWKDQNIPKYNLDFSSKIKRCITSGSENIYLTELVNELIERIRTGNEDPITEVAMYYYEMDDILTMSDDDHFVTHRFASYMEEAAHSILSYLKKKEEEIWKYERKKLLR